MWLGQALIDARFLAPLNRNKEFKSDANVFYKAGENAFAGNFDNSRDFFGTWRRTSGGFLSGASNGVSDSTEAEPPWVQHVHASSSEEESDYEEEQNLIESIRPPGTSSLFPGTLGKVVRYINLQPQNFIEVFHCWSSFKFVAFMWVRLFLFAWSIFRLAIWLFVLNNGINR